MTIIAATDVVQLQSKFSLSTANAKTTALAANLADLTDIANVALVCWLVVRATEAALLLRFAAIDGGKGARADLKTSTYKLNTRINVCMLLKHLHQAKTYNKWIVLIIVELQKNASIIVSSLSSHLDRIGRIALGDSEHFAQRRGDVGLGTYNRLHY